MENPNPPITLEELRVLRDEVVARHRAFTWTFICEVPNPVGEDFSLWACSLCGSVVPGTHEWVHLRTHGVELKETQHER